ncbi:MAG: hypothetical protein NC401_20095 [Ruminococcus sp.]|nr:hypothetical protein [Ruminococcus sp.]
MSIKDGLYLFPEITGLSVYGVHLGFFSEIGRGCAVSDKAYDRARLVKGF